MRATCSWHLRVDTVSVFILESARLCERSAPHRYGGTCALTDACPQTAIASTRVAVSRIVPDDGTLPWDSLSCVFGDTLKQWKSLSDDAPDSTVSPLRTVLRDMLHEAHLGQTE